MDRHMKDEFTFNILSNEYCTVDWEDKHLQQFDVISEPGIDEVLIFAWDSSDAEDEDDDNAFYYVGIKMNSDFYRKNEQKFTEMIARNDIEEIREYFKEKSVEEQRDENHIYSLTILRHTKAERITSGEITFQRNINPKLLVTFASLMIE